MSVECRVGRSRVDQERVCSDRDDGVAGTSSVKSVYQGVFQAGDHAQNQASVEEVATPVPSGWRAGMRYAAKLSLGCARISGFHQRLAGFSPRTFWPPSMTTVSPRCRGVF